MPKGEEHEAEQAAKRAADAAAYEALCADLDALILGAKGITIEALKNIHHRALPLAYTDR